jgi:hypothetical protein
MEELTVVNEVNELEFVNVVAELAVDVAIVVKICVVEELELPGGTSDVVVVPLNDPTKAKAAIRKTPRTPIAKTATIAVRLLKCICSFNNRLLAF